MNVRSWWTASRDVVRSSSIWKRSKRKQPKRSLTFRSGATYALNGNVQKVANNIFIFAPESVDIAAGQDDRSAFDFGGANKNPWK